MKKLFLFIAGLGFLAAIIGCLLGLTAKRVFADERFASQHLKGSGRIVARTQNIPAFKAIDSSRGIRVTVTEAPQGAVRIEADDNLVDLVIAEVKQGTLKIGIDKSVKNLSDYHIEVTVPYHERIGSLKASSASSIVCDRPLKAGETTLAASSAAKIETAVEATTCKIDASSAAKIVAAVTAQECEIETSSASKVKATVTARKCAFDASSASKIEAEGQATRCEASLSWLRNSPPRNSTRRPTTSRRRAVRRPASAAPACSKPRLRAAPRSATRATARPASKNRAAAVSRPVNPHKRPDL